MQVEDESSDAETNVMGWSNLQFKAKVFYTILLPGYAASPVAVKVVQ